MCQPERPHKGIAWHDLLPLGGGQTAAELNKRLDSDVPGYAATHQPLAKWVERAKA